MRTSVVLAVLVALSGALFCILSYGQLPGDIEPGGSVSTEKIESSFLEYLNSLPEGTFVPALLFLKTQVDMATLDSTLTAQRATRQERHQVVVESLRDVAEASQIEVRDYLNEKITDGSVETFTCYWITNAIAVVAQKETLFTGIEGLSEVEEILWNPEVYPIEPEIESGAVPLEPPEDIPMGWRAIKADSVWNELNITGFGRLVANLDSGVDGEHPALEDKWRCRDEDSTNYWKCFRDTSGIPRSPYDIVGHGTHVMGIICGLDSNTVDTIGVAWGAEWIADNTQCYQTGNDIYRKIDKYLGAFQWLADPDSNPSTIDDVPDVLVNSWCFRHNPSQPNGVPEGCFYERWEDAIVNLETAGVVAIFAAGNTGSLGWESVRSPAHICTTTTINFAVGSVDAWDLAFPIYSGSGLGPSPCCDSLRLNLERCNKPEVVAPGCSIYSTVPGGRYEWVSWTGTSMATPHVGGVVALMRQANPDLEVDSIKKILMNTARDLPFDELNGEDSTYGWGIIDAYAAVRAARTRWYVSISGSDSEGIGDSLHPFATIQKGIRIAVDGDTVLVSPGEYQENMDFLGKRILVASYYIFDDDTATISQTIIDGGGNGSVVSFTSEENDSSVLKGFTIQNGSGTEVDESDFCGGGIFTSYSSPKIIRNVIKDNTVTGLGGAIYIEFSSALIERNVIISNSASEGGGIFCAENSLPEIVNNTFYNNSADVVGGISWVGDGITIKNNIVSSSQAGGIKCGSEQFDISYNDVWNNGEEDYIDCEDLGESTGVNINGTPCDDFHNISEDPIFEDAASHNFHLKGGSPCIDAGDPDYPSPNGDRDTIDIGAFEFPEWGTEEHEAEIEGPIHAEKDSSIIPFPKQPALPDTALVIPTEFSLTQNNPNPFNLSTVIEYGLPRDVKVSLVVYNVLGRKVKTLVNEFQTAGFKRVEWNGKDNSGKKVASGVYYYELKAGEFSQTRKMVLMK
jgi:subtilisin family serine protease